MTLIDMNYSTLDDFLRVIETYKFFLTLHCPFDSFCQ
jgi:hypothetical protein